MRHADLIVVGAGVVGTFLAYSAAQRGIRTMLIERNAWPDDASVRNFGIIASSIVDLDGEWAAHARRTAELYRELQRRRDISVRATGSLYLASTEIEDAVLQEFAALGSDIACAYLSRTSALDRYPFLDASYCKGALLFPDDLTINPRRMLRELISYLAESGTVDYIPSTAVTRVESSSKRCVVAGAHGEAFVAGRVIVCIGAACDDLFPEVLLQRRIRVCKLQMMRTEPGAPVELPHAILSGLSIRRYPAFAACPSWRALEAQPIDPFLRANGIHVLMKQDVDGSIVIGDSHTYRDPLHGEPFEERTDCAINDAILSHARTMVRAAAWRIDSLWNGYYSVYLDGPVLTHAVDDRIHLVTGIGGKGMTTAGGFAEHHIGTLFA